MLSDRQSEHNEHPQPTADDEFGDFDDGDPSDNADKEFAKGVGLPHAVLDCDGIVFSPVFTLN